MKFFTVVFLLSIFSINMYGSNYHVREGLVVSQKCIRNTLYINNVAINKFWHPAICKRAIESVEQDINTYNHISVFCKKSVLTNDIHYYPEIGFSGESLIEGSMYAGKKTFYITAEEKNVKKKCEDFVRAVGLKVIKALN